MFTKVLIAALLASCTQALENHGATSSVSFNQQHNVIHHIQSAPAYVKTVAAPVHAAPLALHGGYSSPVAHQVQYAAPVAKVAPYFVSSAGPAQHGTSYSALSFGHAAPIAHQHQGVAVAPLGVVAAPAVHHAVPVAHAAPSAHYEEYAHPKYEFAYGVEDHHTGDFHSHKEVRDGDVTQGEYSLHEADGTIRTVKYSVDKHSGFNAVVERSGHATHAQPVHKAVVAAPVLTKTLVAAPTYSHYHH